MARYAMPPTERSSTHNMTNTNDGQHELSQPTGVRNRIGKCGGIFRDPSSQPKSAQARRSSRIKDIETEKVKVEAGRVVKRQPSKIGDAVKKKKKKKVKKQETVAAHGAAEEKGNVKKVASRRVTKVSAAEKAAAVKKVAKKSAEKKPATNKTAEKKDAAVKKVAKKPATKKTAARKVLKETNTNQRQTSASHDKALKSRRR
ncbi:uncharacterized protein RCC_00225 [Ramularia collo-cygni]|uniref:Uncharacterized protein n=1 Tax=Ramularia collo-cygni TaxID=112498 RepID=A0A2D3UQ79_9PEZI|nr:uncharacterized protein RCC_00225 [Ramularia collo-cygni]CZT14250.1 uncharacterized protein RCC_00225 [Ramularia collo-cygni]